MSYKIEEKAAEKLDKFINYIITMKKTDILRLTIKKKEFAMIRVK